MKPNVIGKHTVTENSRHGMSNHLLYRLWTRIKTRCYNLNDEGYKNYGGRGIEMYQEWTQDPMSFITWALKHGWKFGLQIDRIDNDGPYSPSNCRFVTQQVNIQNCRATKLTPDEILEIRELLDNGISHTQAAQKYKVHQTTITRIANVKAWQNIK